MSWSAPERAQFFARLTAYWPGSVAGKFSEQGGESALLTLWLEEVGVYPIDLALSALRAIKAEEESNRAPSAKAVRRKCGELSMAAGGARDASPRTSHIHLLTTEFLGGNWTSPKGSLWEITSGGLLLIDPERVRTEWTVNLVWGQLSTTDILRIQPAEIVMPAQMTFGEFKAQEKASGAWKRAEPKAKVDLHPVGQTGKAGDGWVEIKL